MVISRVSGIRVWAAVVASIVVGQPACAETPIEGSANETLPVPTGTDTDPTTSPGSDPSVTGTDPSGTDTQGSSSTGPGTNPTTDPTNSTTNPTTDPTNSTTDTTDPSTTSSTGAVDTTNPDPTTSTTGPGTTGVNSECQETVTLSYDIDDAMLYGGWSNEFSIFIGKKYADWQGDPQQDNGVVWVADVPCDDDFHVWVRFRDIGQDDSFFVQVDGAPQEWAIFDGDCGGNILNWRWEKLNWRNPNDNSCQWTEDPWIQSWTAGAHEIHFRFFDATGIAEIKFTNDPNYSP